MTPDEPERRKRFDALVTTHGPLVFGLLVRLLRDRAHAEDLWQEVFWSLWKRLDEIERSRDPLPYLRTVALNRAIDHVRRRRARPILESDETLDERPAAEPRSPDDFEETLGALPPHERAAILLYYQEGRSVAEVAEALAVPTGTVKTWLHRARQRLRRQFEGEERRAEARTIDEE